MSLTKSESARINGAKSRGPKTPAGKAVSSQNATKHGLFAYAIVIRGESPEAFQVFAESYVRRFEPRDDIELDIVRQMTAAMWRIARCWTLQTQTINEEMDLDGYGGDTVAARTFDSLSKRSPALQLLHRFENSYERVYNQAIRTLTNLRKNFPIGPPNGSLAQSPNGSIHQNDPKTNQSPDHPITQSPNQNASSAQSPDRPIAQSPIPIGYLDKSGNCTTDGPARRAGGDDNQWLARSCQDYHRIISAFHLGSG
jgi:hypothetical protein